MTKPRKHPLCGYMDESGTVICDTELEVHDGRYICPTGRHAHRLAAWDDLTGWYRDHETYMQTDPGMHRRYFDPDTDR